MKTKINRKKVCRYCGELFESETKFRMICDKCLKISQKDRTEKLRQYHIHNKTIRR